MTTPSSASAAGGSPLVEPRHRHVIYAVRASLLALVLTRAVAAFLPSMWAWGINIQRFLPAFPAWTLWGIAALSLHPSVGGRLAGPLERLASWLVHGSRGRWVAGLTLALLVLALPDRTWIGGDFQVRRGAAETGQLASTFDQSLPLEVLLDHTIPRALGALGESGPELALRWIGALSAAGLAVAALAVARAWGFAGLAAACAAGVIVFGGYLTVFTGLGKPAAIMCLLVAIVMLGCVRLTGPAGGGALLGLGLAAALLTHRGALLLVPMWAAALLMARRRRRPLDRASMRSLILAASLPVLAAAVVAPRILTIVRSLDVPRHLVPGGTGIVGAAFSPLHLADLANLLLYFTPALAVAVVAACAGGLRGWDTATRILLGLLVAPIVPLLLFVHPVQGVFRDLDAFAMGGVGLAIPAAFAIGIAFRDRLLPAWIAPALLLAVVVPSLQWLMHFHDPAHGIVRARSFALEPPARGDGERARLWDALAYRAFRLQQWDQAVEATGQSARLAPHPRALMMQAIANTYAGHHHEAERIYLDLVTRAPDDPLAWVGLGGAALRVGDSLQIRRALAELETYTPESAEARAIRRHLTAFPEVWPAGEGAGAPR